MKYLCAMASSASTSPFIPGPRRDAARVLRPMGLGVMLLGAVGCSLISDADRYSVESGSVEPPDVSGRDAEMPGSDMTAPELNPSNGSGGSAEQGPTTLVPVGQGGSGLSGAGGSSAMTSPETPPDVVVPPACTNPAVDFDQLFAAIRIDLVGRDAVERVFSRYISLTNRFTAGYCPETLETDRRALFKMLNMLSTNAIIALPQSINETDTLYRIDLRAYDWDRAIGVDGVNFNDVWEAVALSNPYAVPFVGDDADDAVADTGTAFPLMFADQMLGVAMTGNLYYAMIGVDVNQTLSDFTLNVLEIDLQQNLDDEQSLRAGTTRSTLSRQDRLVQRDDIEVRSGFLWQVFDFATAPNPSMFEEPFDVASDSTMAIFSLANGMLGFIIADENSNVLLDSDLLFDIGLNGIRSRVAVSCSGCHAGGIIAVEDEVRAFALANALSLGLTADEVDQLETIYATAAEFARVVDGDMAIYRNALQLAGVPTSGNDLISSVFTRFDEDMRLADAAGDLGVTPAALSDNLVNLSPNAQALLQGSLDRDDFTDLFVDSLCRLSLTLENAPDPAVCDAAAAALGN